MLLSTACITLNKAQFLGKKVCDYANKVCILIHTKQLGKLNSGIVRH